MLASRRAPREPLLHEIPRSFIAPHRQVSLTPHEAEIRLVLPGALPGFSPQYQAFLSDNCKKYLNNEVFLTYFLGPDPTRHGVYPQNEVWELR